jgi:hypothetical protein
MLNIVPLLYDPKAKNIFEKFSRAGRSFFSDKCLDLLRLVIIKNDLNSLSNLKFLNGR